MSDEIAKKHKPYEFIVKGHKQPPKPPPPPKSQDEPPSPKGKT